MGFLDVLFSAGFCVEEKETRKRRVSDEGVCFDAKDANTRTRNHSRD